MLDGCDLSSHNATPPDFSPWGFAFFRVSHGHTTDTSAEAHSITARATNATIQLGAYHYMTDTDGAAQADLLLTREAILGGRMLLAVDVEDLPADAGPPWLRASYAATLLRFVRRVRDAGRPIFVYASANFVRELFHAAPVTMREVARLALLWLADWTAPYPTPEPWTTYAILQDGLKGGRDHNRFDGTLEQLRALGGLGELDSIETRHPTLREGSTGEDVRALQRLLNVGGAALQTDGVFGPLTRAAVVHLQHDAGITPDGIVGAATWRVVLAE